MFSDKSVTWAALCTGVDSKHQSSGKQNWAKQDIIINETTKLVICGELCTAVPTAQRVDKMC